MMATDPEIIATSSSSADHELSITETTSQDAIPEQPTVNGSADKDDSKQDTDNVESNINSAEVSVSGGSDTENSKTETSKSQGEEKGHLRTTSSVKKPASFKPVSVNKTFLAAKGATTAVPSKLGEKGSAGPAPAQAGPSLSTIARPRLVAKSGSGLRDSTPRTSAAGNGGKAGGAPDASAVWNKNRPAPPPEPKRLTDEQLKQQFGIHLATRLQSDDPGKQANWADIDDDDDDWAPETIEWTDGTKITLPSQADEAPIPSPEPTPASIVKEMKAAEAAKPKSPAPTQAAASPTVKPSTFGSGRAGLVLKGAIEKPTLVAKPPGPPTPVKSPWAALPPVDKVAPVAIDIPQQASQPRFGQQNLHGFQGMPPPPAKEIAADDFSRSWREGGNTSRELYNSQSGRYEPVNDNRRGSVRSGDARSHQPAVLQRPVNHDGPAEPSAAFQTHRASGHDGGYNRRRTSSNVSGGSGNFIRRMSRGDMPPPHDMLHSQEMLNVRRGSLAAVSDTPSSPRNFSPSGQQQIQRGFQNQAWQRASPVSQPSPQLLQDQAIPSVATPADNTSQVPPAVYEDPIAIQKKIMLESRALAIKRRQEEEAREEAARKERIRLKLEAMGPAPESKKNKKELAKEEKSAPTQIQSRESVETAAIEKKEPSASVPVESKLQVNSGVAREKAPPAVEQKPADTNSTPETQVNDVQQQNASSNLSHDRSSQSWQSNSSQTSDRFRPWAPAPAQQQSSRNVWGPPTNDRTLGNGTFSPELSRLPDMHQSSHPGPIGPPNVNRASNQSQQGRGREPYVTRPGPIGPPNRAAVLDKNKSIVASSGWASLPTKLKEEDATRAQEQDLEMTRRREAREAGIEQGEEAVVPALQDKWRKVALKDDGTRGEIRGTKPTVHEPSQWEGQPGRQQDMQQNPIFEEQDTAHHRAIDNPHSDLWAPAPHMNTTSTPARGSRFFPNNRDVRLEEQHMSIIFERPGSPSLPPPTEVGHPAYDGDQTRPHVSLPRPPPVVRLPPPPVLAPIGPPKPISFAAAVQTPVVPLVNRNAAPPSRQDYPSRTPHMFQDVRRQEPAAGGWQDRINSLIGRKNSPPKSFALAVDSSSKHALELPSRRVGATVSLPVFGFAEYDTKEGAVESKPAAEECFEEQEMGSLPVIKVPDNPPALAWNPAPSPKPMPRKFMVNHVTSSDSIRFPAAAGSSNNNIITIKVPGQDESKTVSIPATTRQRSNPRRGGNRGGAPRHNSSATHGGRGRDTSGGFSSPSIENGSNSSSSVPGGRGGRGGRGGAYGSSWNRHIPTPVHT